MLNEGVSSMAKGKSSKMGTRYTLVEKTRILAHFVPLFKEHGLNRAYGILVQRIEDRSINPIKSVNGIETIPTAFTLRSWLKEKGLDTRRRVWGGEIERLKEIPSLQSPPQVINYVIENLPVTLIESRSMILNQLVFHSKLHGIAPEKLLEELIDMVQ